MINRLALEVRFDLVGWRRKICVPTFYDYKIHYLGMRAERKVGAFFWLQ